MKSLIELAKQIESDYSGDVPGSVQVCRENMKAIISAENMGWTKEELSDDQARELGMRKGWLKVKAMTSVDGDFIILDLSYVSDYTDGASYALTVDSVNQLQNYKRTYRPFLTENDNCLTRVFDHFKDVWNMVFTEKIDIIIGGPGKPILGKVKGVRLTGDGGETECYATQEQWIFQATYDGGWKIASWRY